MATKSLGTLTLDLVANLASFEKPLERSQRIASKTFKSWEKDIKKASAAVIAYTSSASAAVTAMAISHVDAAAEITRLSQLSGTSTTEFQKYAAGANLVGIEQEKLADIFKDTNDKVGDFLQNNAGPLKDFFTNIAPKVGVTAEQFKNLSGPQALELYASSLEKANLSQADMTFYMEAIASDATGLLPLLKNNSEGFKDLGEQAENAGAILNDKTISSAQEAQAMLYLLQIQSEGLKNQFVSALIPTLTDTAKAFADFSVDGGGAVAIGESLAEVFKKTAVVVTGVAASIELIGKTAAIAGIAIANIFDKDKATEPGQALSETQAAFKEGVADLKSSALEYAELIDNILNAGESVGNQNKKTKDAIQDIMKVMENLKANNIKTTNTISNMTTVIEQEIKALEKQAEAIGLSSDEIKIQELQTKGATEADIARAKAALATVAAFKQQEEAIKTAAEAEEEMLRNQEDINENVVDIRRRLTSPEDQINADFQKERELVLANTEITGKEQTELLKQLEVERQSELAAIQDQRLANAQAIAGNLTDIAKKTAGEQSGIYKALFDVEQAIGIARSIVAIQTGIAEAAANPFPANLAAMASVAAATASIVSTIQGVSIQGQAHDGLMSVPQTGTYLLEKGERVTTQRTSAKLDRTLDDVRSSGSAGSIKVIVVQNMEEAFKEMLKTDPGQRAVMAVLGENSNEVKALAEAS